MKKAFAFTVVAGLAAAASAQNFEIYAVAPAQVNIGDTYTVEFWGEVSGGSFVQGTSAIAGFGISALGTGDVAGLTTATFGSLSTGTNAGTVAGSNLNGVIGGQLPNIFGLNPNINLSNPILLFSFQVTAGGAGIITYTPGNPNPNGALTYFPVSTAGASVNNNAAGATLTLTGAETRVVPAPASVALLGLGALAARRRR